MKGKKRFSFLVLLVFIILGSIRLASAANIPKEAKIHNQLGNDYCDKGEFEKGVEEYEKAVDLYPFYSDGLYNLCMTYYLDLKDYGKAVYYMKQFLEIETETADAKQVKKWLGDAEQKAAALKSTIPDRVKEVKRVKKIKEEKVPSQKILKTAKPPAPKPEPPASVASSAKEVPTSPIPKTKGIASLKKEKAFGVISPQEQAREYKQKGNDYNRMGKSEEAVEYYLKALELYPEYTDALYNIAKTYDFDIKDYNKAIHYYKQFLKYESPSSRDAAQAKVWLGRLERVYAKQKEEAASKPATVPKIEVASVPVALPKTALTPATKKVAVTPYKVVPTSPVKKMTKSAPPMVKKMTKHTPAGGGEKLAGFYIKDLLPLRPVEPKKSAQMKKVTSQRVSQSAAPKKEVLAPPPAPVVSPGKEAVVASLSQKSSGSGQVADNRQIVIETVIPRNLMGTKWASLSMQRMQQEIVKVLAENKVKSPQKLAELYSSKIQSDILSSGEKVSSFRLEGKELSDLPYVNILTQTEKRNLEREKWELIRTRKSPTRLREVLTTLRKGYKIER